MIKTWQARRFEMVLEAGRTRPLVVDCLHLESLSDEEAELSEPTPESRLMVIKSLGHPGVTETSLFCEVFGNLLARELGIGTAEPALIDLSPEFVQAVNPVVATYGITMAPAIGVGCEYLSGGLRPATPLTYLTADEFEQATAIYGFDLLVQNPDRRPDKPNCAVRGGSLLAYDFEMCFSFLYHVIGEAALPWEVSRNDIGARHLFRSALKSRAPNWAPLLDSLRHLSKDHLDRLVSDLPGEWLTHAPRVRQHLADVIMELPQFELELQRSLL